MMHGKHSPRKNQPLSWEIVLQKLRSNTAHCVYVLLACMLVLCALFLVAITPSLRPEGGRYQPHHHHRQQGCGG